jgi:Family of unknown function (DUF6279)
MLVPELKVGKCRNAIVSPAGLLRIIGVVLAAFVMTGCTAIKLAYNQAPELMYLYIDRYFDFNSEQSQEVKAELTHLQAWHRKTQLASYIEMLKKLQPQMSANFSPAQACETVADVRAKLLAVVTHVEPGSARVAVKLTDQQFDQLEKKFGRDNAKFREEYLDASATKMRKKRLKDATERAEKLYGRLEERQLATLGQTINQSNFDAKIAYTERLRRQGAMLQTLRGLSAAPNGAEAATSQRAVEAVKGLLQQPFVSSDPAYRRYLEAQTQESCKGFADLHNVTTPEQRQHAVRTLRQYEEDFRMLAAQTPG